MVRSLASNLAASNIDLRLVAVEVMAAPLRHGLIDASDSPAASAGLFVVWVYYPFTEMTKTAHGTFLENPVNQCYLILSIMRLAESLVPPA